MASDLPACKRHIATHDADGKSVYVSSPPPQHYHPSTAGGVARSWSVANVPAVLANDADMKAYLSSDTSNVTSFARPDIVLPSEDGKNNGANLLVVDLKPGGFSAMHQTVSIDFSICVIGTIIHELDGGERVVLKPGDHIVQRGTNHRWINASETESARFIAVTLPCVPFDIAGKKLEQVFLPNEPGYEPKRALL